MGIWCFWIGAGSVVDCGQLFEIHFLYYSYVDFLLMRGRCLSPRKSHLDDRLTQQRATDDGSSGRRGNTAGVIRRQRATRD